MLAALVTALAACASGGGDPDQYGPPSATLAIEPAALELEPGGVQQFTVAAAGSDVIEVMWSVEGGGSVSSTGLYTAPETVGTYRVVATSAFDAAEMTAAVVTVKENPAPPPPPPPPPPANTQGTGTTHAASHLTGVNGGGPMPSWTTNVVTASCAGNGTTDDTACLQAAANAARSQGKVLVIPATSAYYKISAPIAIYTSVGGVGGMPTIRQTNTSSTAAGVGLKVAASMTGWIHNLHIVGTHNGTNGSGEHAHNIDVGSVTGLTIHGNLLENAMGDAVGTDYSAWDGGSKASVNVVVDGNTMRNPRRCAVALVMFQRDWVITNNIIDKPVNFVSGIDIEPEGATVTNVEIAYNKFIMNNRTPNPNRGADGKAVFGWQTPYTPNPGGNFYIHHNYGTFGTGFLGFDGRNWGYVDSHDNREGATVP